MPRPTCFLIVVIALALLLLVYGATYLLLTANGAYLLAGTDLIHGDWFQWAPRGFHVQGAWITWPQILFAPLYHVDCRWWHPSSLDPQGKVPFMKGPEMSVGMEGI